jgi:phosphoribosyl 1,2-cyclic phosphodiesterase
MQVTLWGTRGSLATPGPEMARYGGNTSCVGVVGREGTMLVLDAGTGIRRLAATIPESLHRVDILLTHLHMDHIQGLGFFAPVYRPDFEVHIWGPASATLRLQARLMRYLSPPLFRSAFLNSHASWPFTKSRARRSTLANSGFPPRWYAIQAPPWDIALPRRTEAC